MNGAYRLVRRPYPLTDLHTIGHQPEDSRLRQYERTELHAFDASIAALICPRNRNDKKLSIRHWQRQRTIPPIPSTSASDHRMVRQREQAEYAKRHIYKSFPLETRTHCQHVAINIICTVQRNCSSFTLAHERLRVTDRGLARADRQVILVPLGDRPTRVVTPAATNHLQSDPGAGLQHEDGESLFALCPPAVLQLTRRSPGRSMSTCPAAGSRLYAWSPREGR